MIAENLSKTLGLSVVELISFAKTCPWRYKVYEIKKRNGGKRTIAQPSRQLKMLQRFVQKEFLWKLPVHKTAVAYRKKVGIGSNAGFHASNPFILKMDFSNFFPSIIPFDLLNHYEIKTQSKLHRDDEILLTGIFFCRNRTTGRKELSIGAPSSPFISNTIMHDFDVKISEYASSQGVLYTRYADDLTFSCSAKNQLQDIHRHVLETCKSVKYPRLTVNAKKTLYLSKRGRREITGLIVTNDGTVSLGRDKKRLIKSLVHRFIMGQLESDKVNFLKGYLSFANDVEPSFIASLEKKYGEIVLNKIRMS